MIAMINEDFSVNNAGNLTMGGVDTIELARQYKTPLYIMNEEVVRKNCRLFKNSIDEYYQGKGLVCYASKAFSCKQIYRIIKDEGIGIDVVSVGELYTALSVGFDPSKICYHGNNKSVEELTYALKSGVCRIVADSVDELYMINTIADSLGIHAGVLLRLSPGIDAHTHEFVRTGGIDSKFGFAIELGTAMEAVQLALNMPNIILMGIHCHIGSQIFELEPFKLAARVMISFIADIKSQTGYTVSELNLGGGFGIKYTAKDDPLPYQSYMEIISEVVKGLAIELDVKLPFIIIEPGRSIVGGAGITIYEVGSIKEIKDIRTYVCVDGGMTDNIRFPLYGSEYEFAIANRILEPKTQLVTVAGRCCESGDILGKDVALQACKRGDYLVTFDTGAYNYSMSSNYNRTLRPAVVFVKDGSSYIAVKRETNEDLVRNDI